MPERFKTAQFEQSEPSATCRQSHRHFGNDLIAILFNQRMRLNQSAAHRQAQLNLIPFFPLPTDGVKAA